MKFYRFFCHCIMEVKNTYTGSLPFSKLIHATNNFRTICFFILHGTDFLKSHSFAAYTYKMHVIKCVTSHIWNNRFTDSDSGIKFTTSSQLARIAYISYCWRSLYCAVCHSTFAVYCCWYHLIVACVFFYIVVYLCSASISMQFFLFQVRQRNDDDAI